jgi:hypothetical protein
MQLRKPSSRGLELLIVARSAASPCSVQAALHGRWLGSRAPGDSNGAGDDVAAEGVHDRSGVSVSTRLVYTSSVSR